jgi:hypothetical protein
MGFPRSEWLFTFKFLPDVFLNQLKDMLTQFFLFTVGPHQFVKYSSICFRLISYIFSSL